jgi:hypothetical protein
VQQAGCKLLSLKPPSRLASCAAVACSTAADARHQLLGVGCPLRIAAVHLHVAEMQAVITMHSTRDQLQVQHR